MKCCLEIFGLILISISALLAIYPLLRKMKNIKDDFVVLGNKKGAYYQMRDMKNQRLGFWCLSLLIIGATLQIVGMIIK